MKNLRVGFCSPPCDEVKQEEHQKSTKQTAEQVECSGADAHCKEEELPFCAENR